MSSLSLFLPLAIFAPLGAIGLMAFALSIHERWVRPIALLGFLVPFLIAALLAFQYHEHALASGDYAYIGFLPIGLDAWGIRMSFGLNGISLPLFLLATCVGLAAGIYAVGSNVKNQPLYLTLLLIIYSGLLGTFASTNLFFFFFFHEMALIPTFIAIGMWGGLGRRSTAMELTVYLTVGAMVTIAGLILLYSETAPFLPTFDMQALGQFFALLPIEASMQSCIFALLLIGFGILVSLFPFHTWAPKAYATAPAPVAMMHAGVLKKFGLYGLIQVAVPFLPAGAADWNHVLAILAIGNVLYIGWVTVAQRDLKLMLGYSSVMHMGYAFLGIATLSNLGLGSAIVLMVGHGLTVALLFLLSTSLYERTQTYHLEDMGGLIQKTPILAAFFVAASMASLGLPGFLNFWGELGIFISLWAFNPIFAICAVFGVIISAIYGLRAVAHIFFGPVKISMQSVIMKDLCVPERVSALFLLILLLVFGFWPKPLTDMVNAGLVAKSFVLTPMPADTCHALPMTAEIHESI